LKKTCYDIDNLYAMLYYLICRLSKEDFYEKVSYYNVLRFVVLCGGLRAAGYDGAFGVCARVRDRIRAGFRAGYNPGVAAAACGSASMGDRARR